MHGGDDVDVRERGVCCYDLVQRPTISKKRKKGVEVCEDELCGSDCFCLVGESRTARGCERFID